MIGYLINNQLWLFEWQTLIGSILGVIGALFVTFIGFISNHFYQKYKEIRENIRLTEINLALGLNDIYDTERHLKDFIDRVNLITITPLKNNPSQTQYFLSETNFPILSIHIDPPLLSAKYKSYYVHNKILIITKNMKRVNENFVDMKIKYESIVDKAKFLMQNGATPLNQQRDYLQNNESFIEFTKDIINQLQLAKKVFAETKIYNLKLLNKNRLAIWCLEGISFKFFFSRKNIVSYRGTLYCLDRIDLVLSEEVTSIMKDVDARGINNTNQKRKYAGDWLYKKIRKLI